MLKRLILLIILFFSLVVCVSAQENTIWKEYSDKMTGVGLNKKNKKVYELDKAAFKYQIQKRGIAIVDFPDINGNIVSYRVEEASVMHSNLAAKFPNNKSYKGIAIENPYNTVRFSMNGLGLHAVIRHVGKNPIYINPVSNKENLYSVFKKSDFDSSNSFDCLVEENVRLDLAKSSKKLANDLKLRTFELALATTGEYSQFHIAAAGVTNGSNAEKIQAVMDAVEVSINRVNEIFERDLALTLQLVPNTDLLFYLDANSDPYSNGDGVAMLSENQTNIDAVIGANNYDIGHVFSTGGGGIATLASPCSGGKARGVTGQVSPVGDPFSVDFVAHELGHQFGANHTFNGNAGSCADNRNNNTAVEPGSGTTIMSYAGICAPQNVQPLVNDYFHAISIEEMFAFISSGATNCDDETTLVNNANVPTANAGADFTVPVGTPLLLRGIGADADGDSLTYIWEQIDNGTVSISSPPIATQTQGAMFRSLPPVLSNDRYLPELATVLQGNLSSTWQVLPTVARTMDFRLTVRDNALGGGQTAFDDMRVTIEANAGPFEITSQNENEVFWAAGTQETISWNVANTNVAPVNCANVNILLSLDGGTSFPITLASNVPNDGSHVIVVPNSFSTDARVLIEGVNHIFYAVNQKTISITNDFAISISENMKEICAPEDAVYDLNLNFASGFNQTVMLSATNVPNNAVVNFEPNEVNGTSNVQMTISNSDNISLGSYTIDVVGTAGSITRSSQVQLAVFNNALTQPQLTSPANGSNAVLSLGSSFNWVENVNAQTYDIEISSDANFTSIVETSTTTSNNYDPQNLIDATTYYWRVRSNNVCSSSMFSETFVFTTSEIVCNSYETGAIQVTIPDNDENGINAILTMPDNVVINDINVTVNITHSWMRDLIISVQSPSGTKVELFERQCRGNQGNVNMAATFDDEGEILVCANSSPVITGFVIPQEMLRQFDGESSEGDWVLSVNDVASEDTGILTGWSIDVCESRAVAAINGETFGNLLVWPNPAEQSVNISFTSLDQNDTQIKLYDTLGRLILKQSYSTQSVVFKQNIDVSAVSSGMYFVQIKKGAKETTRRLLIK